MISGLKSIRQERASLERDRVVLGSMIEDGFFEGVSSEEIEELIDKIPQSDEEDEQIEKILKSEDDLGVDEILGVEDSGYMEEE